MIFGLGRNRKSGPQARVRVDRAMPAWLKRLVKVGMALTVVLVSVPLFPLSRRADGPHYAVGQVVEGDIIAPIAFDVLRGEDEIQRDREEAVRSVPPLFNVDGARAEATLNRLSRFGQDARRIAGLTHLKRAERAEMLGQLGVPLTLASRRVMADADTAGRIVDEVSRIVAGAYEVGLIDQADLPLLDGRLKVQLQRDGQATLHPSYELYDGRRILETADQRARQLFPGNRDAAEAMAELAQQFSDPNLIYLRAETVQKEVEARSAVPTTAGRVEKGERVISGHTKVTNQDFDRLRSLDVATARLDREPGSRGWFLPLLGRALLVGMLVVIFAAFLRRHRPRLYDDLNVLAFMTTTGILVLVVAALITRFAPDQSPYLIPVGMSAILITLLLDDQLAAATSVAMAVLIGIVGGLGLPFVIVSIVGSVAAVYSVIGLRHRWQFYRSMLFMSLAYALTILAVELISSDSPFRVALRDSIWGVVNAVTATTTVIVLLPVFERVFGLSTDITLLELADLNRPIFRKMMIEANGTYHHTMVIGSLAEGAANSIDANPLLARVGAYYHDIGKVPKAEYFGENLKPGMKNPHEKLTPTMSCLILESHVREGIEMARELKLPRVVADFIPEHQGTTLMSYFFHKALEMDPGVDERDYRYPGPKPQSKETAIVMLADSVEATARSLSDPTPSRLKAVVKRIIDQRAADGQLDECNLTLQELARVRDAFVPILVGLFHGRIRYQWQKDEENESQPTPRPAPDTLDRSAR